MARAAENLGAVGIGVSDIARSEDFYTRVLGMSVQQRIDLPHLKEVVVGYEGRTTVVLMHWLDGSERNYRANAVKLVFFVPNPKAVIASIRAEGLPIQREAEVMPEFHNMMIGLAEDPDGYVVELLELARPAEAPAAAPGLSAVQRLEIEQGCARLALDYAFLADSARMDEWSELFAHDGEMHLFGQVHKGPAAIRAAVGAGAEPGAVTAHAITNHRVDVLSPDEAEGVAYVIVFAGQKKHGGPPPAAPRISPVIVGVYRDRYRRTDTGWKFACRAFEPTFTTATA